MSLVPTAAMCSTSDEVESLHLQYELSLQVDSDGFKTGMYVYTDKSPLLVPPITIALYATEHNQQPLIGMKNLASLQSLDKLLYLTCLVPLTVLFVFYCIW